MHEGSVHEDQLVQQSTGYQELVSHIYRLTQLLFVHSGQLCTQNFVLAKQLSGSMSRGFCNCRLAVSHLPSWRSSLGSVLL